MSNTIALLCEQALSAAALAGRIKTRRSSFEKPVINSARPNLQHCPAEILSEIVCYLDLVDVLRLRQVSHLMDAVTRLRPLWKSLAVEHEGTVLLRKQLDLCASEELEGLVQRAKAGLKPISDKWRIVISIGHTLLQADDDPDAAWRTLIPSYETPVQYSSISCDHVVGAPALTIHLALAVGRSFLPSESRGPVDVHRTDVYEVSVWRISPMFDENGLIDGLHADRLSYFRPTKGLNSMKIQGEYIIFTRENPSSVYTVVRWVEADNRNDYPRRIVYHTGCTIAHILAGRFLLVGCTSNLTYATLSLWDLSLIPFDCNDDHAVAGKPPLWLKKAPRIVSYWPSPWIASGIVYQLIPRKSRMLIVAVPLRLGPATISTQPANGAVYVFEADHEHGWLSITSSQGVIAYRVAESRLVDAPRDGSGKSFVVAHIHHHDHDGPPSFASQRFNVPFRPNLFSPILDMYSSRLVFYGYSHIHLCSLSENY